MLNVIILGPPGSGKGTQSQKIAEKYNLLHISTGEMLRREIKERTELGLLVKDTLSRGELVSDEIVTSMIASTIDSDTIHQGFLYDGYPRTISQVRQLQDILNVRGMSVDILLLMEVEHDELVKRLSGRGAAFGRPDDQSVEVINNRLEIYRQVTEPLVDHYCKTKTCAPVNGMGSVNEVFGRICRAIEIKCKL